MAEKGSGPRCIGHSRRYAALLAVIGIAAALAFTWWIKRDLERGLRAELLERARIASRSIPPERVAALTGSAQDLDSRDYQWLKAQLAGLRSASSTCRFLYLMGRRPDGNVFFFVDSLPPGHEDYAPPGLDYDEVPDTYLPAFETGREAIAGPVTDRWGTLVTALIPISDPGTGRLLAVLGMDVDARSWRSHVFRESALSIGAVLLLTTLLTVLLFAHGSLRAKRDALRERELFLGNVFDAIQDGLSVLDPDRTVIQVNGWLTRMYGDQAPLEGKKCYVAYQQRDSACPWCPSIKAMETGTTQRSEVPYPSAEEARGWLELSAYPLKDERGQLTGVIEYAKDITARKTAERMAAQRADFERLVSEVSSDLVGLSLGVMDAGIDRTLAAIGTFAGVDRAYVFQYKDGDGKRMDNTHEWCAEGIVPQIESLKDILFSEELPWFAERILRREIFHVPDVAALPSEARLEREHFEAQSIQSLIAVPMVLGDKDFGFLGFDAVRARRAWTDDDRSLLLLVGQTITHALNRKLAEEARYASERRFRTLVENTPLGIWQDTEDGQTAYINPAMCELLGVGSPEEVSGHNWKSLFTAESLETIREQTKKRPKGVSSQYEVEVRTKEGKSRRLIVRGAPLMSPDGKLEGTLASFADITERTQAEEALRESEEKYRGIFDESVAAIYVFDTEKNFVDANGAGLDLLGYSREELLSLSIPDVDADPDVVLPAHAQLLGGANLVNYEHRLRRKDGTTIVVLNNSRPLTDDCGQVIGMQSTLIDITERKRLEEEKLALERQVQHAQKLESLGVLAGGIAHDFNNILAAVLGYADLAMADLGETHPALSSVRKIVAGATRAAELTRQMLAYSGKGKFVIEKLDVSALLDDMAHLLRTSIPRTITLNLDLKRSLPPVQGDVAQMQQVVMNLITNAADAIGEEHGAITLSSGTMECGETYLARNLAASSPGDHRPPPGTYVYLEVHDTGCGMDGHTKARLFEPFFSTKFAGRGLGMAAVLGIVRGHQGAIMLDSEPGKGATFRVLFPISQRDDQDASKTRRVVPDVKTVARHGTILVVDDEEAVCSVAKSMLERQGFTVLVAGDGDEGLKIFRTHAAEVICVLLDLTMPRLSGEACFEALRHVRDDVKVIVMSGYTEEQASELFPEERPAGFLHKPFRQAVLNEKIEEVLSQII